AALHPRVSVAFSSQLGAPFEFADAPLEIVYVGRLEIVYVGRLRQIALAVVLLHTCNAAVETLEQRESPCRQGTVRRINRCAPRLRRTQQDPAQPNCAFLIDRNIACMHGVYSLRLTERAGG